MHSTVRATHRRLAVAVATATMTALLPTSAVAAPAPAPTVVPTNTFSTLLEDVAQGAVRKAERRLERQAQRRAERLAAEEAARQAAEAARSQADKVMDLAAREAGDPYVWGAAGPSAFDCSGYTMYVFDQLGIDLPHSSAAQAAMARPVSDPEVGDLVFFGGSNVYHVGIYAGDGLMWHAPRPGKSVTKEPIWTGDVSYGRVG